MFGGHEDIPYEAPIDTIGPIACFESKDDAKKFLDILFEKEDPAVIPLDGYVVPIRLYGSGTYVKSVYETYRKKLI